MVGTLPDDVLLAASDIACFASQQPGCKAIRWPALYPLADHLQFYRPARRRPAQRSQPARARGSLHLPRASSRDRPGRARHRAKKHTGAKLGQNEATSIALPSLTPRSMAWAAPGHGLHHEEHPRARRGDHSVEKQLAARSIRRRTAIRFLRTCAFGSPLYRKGSARRRELPHCLCRPPAIFPRPTSAHTPSTACSRKFKRAARTGTLYLMMHIQPSAIGFADRVSKTASRQQSQQSFFGF